MWRNLLHHHHHHHHRGWIHSTFRRTSRDCTFTSLLQTFSTKPSSRISTNLDTKKEIPENNNKHALWNIPNAITITRIGTTPFLSWLILQDQYTLALGGLVLAGVSDFLDGYIAKTYDQQTIIGSFLDPLADKFLLGSVSLTMGIHGLLPLWLVSLIIGRDVCLIAGTVVHRLKSKSKRSAFLSTTDTGSFEVQPSFVSKVNTVLQFSLLGVGLGFAIVGPPSTDVLEPVYTLVALSTLGSGVDYTIQYLKFRGAFQRPKK